MVSELSIQPPYASRADLLRGLRAHLDRHIRGQPEALT